MRAFQALGIIDRAATLDPPHEFATPEEFRNPDGRVVVAVRGFRDAVDRLKRLSKPFLTWTGKAERLSFDVPTLPLFVRTIATDVSSVLFGRARRLILGWLLGHPDETFFLRQIVRQTQLSPGSVQRELEQLVAAGLVTRTLQGRQVYFQADRSSPVFPELQSLFVKTAGLETCSGPRCNR